MSADQRFIPIDAVISATLESFTHPNGSRHILPDGTTEVEFGYETTIQPLPGNDPIYRHSASFTSQNDEESISTKTRITWHDGSPDSIQPASAENIDIATIRVINSPMGYTVSIDYTPHYLGPNFARVVIEANDDPPEFYLQSENGDITVSWIIGDNSQISDQTVQEIFTDAVNLVTTINQT